MFDEIAYSWGPWVYNKLSNGVLKVMDFAKRIYRDFYTTKAWIFLNALDVPISTETFVDSGVPNTYIRWRATLDPPVFTDPNVESNTLKNLSYLSLELILGDIDPIDITEWVNDVKWSGSVEPTLKDIITLWSCEKGMCLFHYYSTMQVSIITDTGLSVKKGLNETSRTNIHERDGAEDGPDSNRVMDVVFSSSGR
jgi:hypothetical protein